MNKEWKDLVTSVRNGAGLNRNAPEITSTIGSWYQEEADLCMKMSRHVGRAVGLKVERRLRDNPAERAKQDAQTLAESKQLVTRLQVPDAASDIDVCANLSTRAIVCSMEVDAPKDKKSTKARVNWLLRQVSKAGDTDIYLRAKWPGRAQDTIEPISKLLEDPEALQAGNEKLVPRAFEVVMVKDIAGKFSGTVTFIEQLEEIVPHFYDQVGQYLRAWQAAPPKPRSVQREEATGEGEEAAPVRLEAAQAEERPTQSDAQAPDPRLHADDRQQERPAEPIWRPMVWGQH